MADSSSLRVMCIFEVCSRLRCESELACLAAFTYHRFFKLKEKGRFDLYAFATASVKLAHRFCNKNCNERNLILAMINIIHGPDLYLTKDAFQKLTNTINIAEKIIGANLEYQLNFKVDRMITPGQLEEQRRARLLEERNSRHRQAVQIDGSDEESPSDDDDRPLPKDDSLLARNSKNPISSHRYLVHYLRTIKHLLPQDCEQTKEIFKRISNIAWVLLCDYHWCPNSTQIYASHLACSCLMMAIQIFCDQLKGSKSNAKSQLWRLLDRKWNLIFCDDFFDHLKDRAIEMIIVQYNEYERLMKHELNLTVIDPSSH